MVKARNLALVSLQDVKINLIKMLDKYLKLKKSLLSLNFLKDYSKTMKEIYKESGSEFK